MKRTKLILFFMFVIATTTFGDTYTSHQKPITDSTLDIGTSSLFWRYIYGDSFTDGTALWNNNSLSGFTSISGITLTDGTFVISGGVVRSGRWNGTPIDISDYTNLVAGTNITLSGDTLSIGDIFLVNDTSDTTTGTLTAAGFTTTGTVATGDLIITSDPPDTITSAGTVGEIQWDGDWIYVAVANNSWKRAALSTWGVTGDTMIYEDSNTMVFEDGNTMIYD